VTQAAGLFLGQHDHLDGLLGEPLEHEPGPDASGSNLSGLNGSVAGAGALSQKRLRSWAGGKRMDKRSEGI
jgi:hypothetical protein